MSARSTRTSLPSFVSVLIYLLYSQALKTSEASFVLADWFWFDYPGGSLLFFKKNWRISPLRMRRHLNVAILSASVAIAPASPLPNRHDPALKPNPHPYPIKASRPPIRATFTFQVPRTQRSYLYVPPPGTPTRSQTKSRPDYRMHR